MEIAKINIPSIGFKNKGVKKTSIISLVVLAIISGVYFLVKGKSLRGNK